MWRGQGREWKEVGMGEPGREDFLVEARLRAWTGEAEPQKGQC